MVVEDDSATCVICIIVFFFSPPPLFDVALRPSDIFLDDSFMPSILPPLLSLIVLTILSITIMATLRRFFFFLLTSVHKTSLDVHI